MKSIMRLRLTTVAMLPLASLHDSGGRAERGIDRRPVVHGYAYNDYLRAASDVRLLVETLDASGAVIARTVGFVRGTVAFNGCSYFEVPLKTPGASYRVSVTAFDWKDSGGGSGGT